MENLQVDELTIRVDRSSSGCLRLDWQGYSSLASPGERIGPFFTQVLTEARESGSVVEMHFEGLKHFNSATIALLIQLIYASGKAKVPLHIHYDAKQRWQALSFEALERATQSFGGSTGSNVAFFSA